VDVNDFRNLVTLLSFVLFAGIVRWAMAKRNQARFDEAQMLPFLDEPIDATGRTHPTRTETLK
jgi:cytochrome c oxidase cbb3-type subunit IV